MGECKYVLAKDTANTFEISSKNRICNGRATCAVSVSVTVKGLKINVDHGGQPTVFGIVVNLPYRNQGKTMQYKVILLSNVTKCRSE